MRKMASMLEFITHEEYEKLMKMRNWRDSPLMVTALEINEIYNREIPEVQPLMDLASEIAGNRGHIRTLLGRRARFPEKKKIHKALNRRIQGSAADINKIKLVEIHEARKETGFLLRFTVHDEMDGDTPDRRCTIMVREILNRQSIKTPVPILWDVETGPNWAHTKEFV
jgi:DNA polymerase I-like protein with 3'-5' exonuclease and polymerase domains